MWKFVSGVIKDIKKGSFIESYITLALIIVIVVLDVFNVSNSEWVSNITLAVLALIVYGRIQDQRLLDRLVQNSQTYFNKEFPSNLKDDLESAKEIWMVAISLSRTMNTYYSLLENKLREGCLIRVLLVRPNTAASRMAIERDHRPLEPDEYDQAIIGTLRRLEKLRKINADKLEIRTADITFTYGYYAIDFKNNQLISDASIDNDPESNIQWFEKPGKYKNCLQDGILYLEHYGFRNREGDVPRMIFKPEDGEWYNQYKAQLIRLWSFSEPWGNELRTQVHPDRVVTKT